MTLVVDCSFIVAGHLPDEATDEVAETLRLVAESGAIAPVHWPAEIANALNAAIRRSRITTFDRELILEKVAELGVEIDPETNDHIWSASLQLSDKYGLTIYDAAYLELAQRLRQPLATLDKPLAAAAREAGVAVLP